MISSKGKFPTQYISSYIHITYHSTLLLVLEKWGPEHTELHIPMDLHL